MKIKVNDIIVLKTWGELVEDYGTNDLGNIERNNVGMYLSEQLHREIISDGFEQKVVKIDGSINILNSVSFGFGITSGMVKRVKGD